MRRLLLTALACIVPSVCSAFAVPSPEGFVLDQVGVLSTEQEQQLETELQQYKIQTTNEIGVLVIASLQGEVIANLAVEVGRSWGIGSKQRDNGILLLVAIEDRELFIATGYGMEGAVPDLAAKRIIDDVIVPLFKQGNYPAGISAGIAALQERIGGEYTAVSQFAGGTSNALLSVSDVAGAASGLPWPIILLGIAIGCFILFCFSRFVLGFLVTLSPSRSWWEGVFIGGMFGFFFLGFSGLLVAGVLGGLIDFFVSLLFVKSKRYQTFIKKQKKNMKNAEGMWIGTGGGRGGGGGGFSGGGGFGGGGAGGGW